MKEEKKCTYCLEDIDYKKHGLSKYCSVKCRNKDYYKKNKLKTENYSENESTSKEQSEILSAEYKRPNQSYSGSDTNEIIFGNERGENRTSYSYSAESSGKGNDIVRYYDAKIEATRYELKCEYLENRIKELEQEIIHLEAELDECNAEDSDDQNNIIGSLVSSFKSDPLTTIEFGSAMIQKLFNKNNSKDQTNQP